MNYKILETIRDYPVEIARWLGMDKLTDLHNGWLRSFLFSDDDITLQSHRGSYKTTCIAVFFALHVLIKPEESLLYLRKTDSDVRQVARQVAGFIRSDCFQKMAVELWGTRINIIKESAAEIDTDLSRVVSGASQISGLGLGSSITGKHADVIVTDDIVNINDRISKAERERTKYVFMELQNIKNRGGRFINCGTPWHKDDAFSLMNNIVQYDCYNTGLIGKDELQKLRKSMSDSLFAANYELKHIADEDAMFTEPKYTADVSAIYDGVAHIDAAYGGDDSTAFTILAEKDDNLIVFGRKYDKHVDDCIDDILALKQKYRAGTTYCEKNADKGYLKKSLVKRGDMAQTYHEDMNKHIKISTYLKENWERVLFLDTTDPDYINQILDYTENAAHDDCPDSLASIIRQVCGKGQLHIKTFKGGI